MKTSLEILHFLKTLFKVLFQFRYVRERERKKILSIHSEVTQLMKSTKINFLDTFPPTEKQK